ncbi:hypothetical protein ACQZV8_18050 [Magnetococcales bacterium HHB-1]
MRTLYEVKNEGQKVTVVGDDRGDIETYADGVHGIRVLGPNVKLNLYTLSTDSTPDNQRREIVSRLVMPVDSFLELSEYLGEQARVIRKGIEAEE